MYVITDHDHDYYKQSVKPRCTGDFVDCAVQTDLTMEDVEHMETYGVPTRQLKDI